jgi:hypothetical protein
MKNIFKTLILLVVILVLNPKAIAQAVNKPSIMVFPEDGWMEENHYMIDVNDQGTIKKQPDYAKALLNKDLYSVITKIEQLMADRGYPLENLGSTLKGIADSNALKNAETSEDGENIEEGPKDKLLSTARPDIILYVKWNVNTIGLRKSVKFTLSGIDAGTNKPQATATGTGPEVMGATLDVMLETAVLDHIDGFNNQLMTFFDNMVAKGREISVELQVFGNSPKKFNTEVNDEGDELSDIITKWMKDNTVNGAATPQLKTATLMKFSGVRIPLRGEDGTAFTNDDFGTKLRKFLRKTLVNVPCSSYPVGTGKAVVIVGGKSK